MDHYVWPNHFNFHEKKKQQQPKQLVLFQTDPRNYEFGLEPYSMKISLESLCVRVKVKKFKGNRNI